MAVIYTVKHRKASVVTMVDAKGHEKTVEIERLRTGGIRAGYQLTFKNDAIAAENMSFRRDDSQPWKLYSSVSQSGSERRREDCEQRGQIRRHAKSGVTPAKFQFC